MKLACTLVILVVTALGGTIARGCHSDFLCDEVNGTQQPSSPKSSTYSRNYNPLEDAVYLHYLAMRHIQQEKAKQNNTAQQGSHETQRVTLSAPNTTIQQNDATEHKSTGKQTTPNTL